MKKAVEKLILSEYENLKSLIENIAYLTNNESTDFINTIYYYILYNYGNRTLFKITDIETETLANIINYKYGDLWEKIKQIYNSNVSLINYEDTETTNNKIYGYNSENGVNDYIMTKTILKNYPDIYENFKNAIDFFKNNCYYNIISCCIIKEITLCVYDNE